MSSSPEISVIAFIRSVEQMGISAINYYRAWSPLTTLGKQDRRFKTRVLDQTILKKVVTAGMGNTLLGHSLYVVSRLFAGRTGRKEFIQAIRDHGGSVIFDTDDDLTDEYRDLGRGEDFVGILQDTDAVTVSTPHLAKRLALHAGRKPWVLPNHVDVDWFAQSSMAASRKTDNVTVGFIGTASHYHDWQYPVKALRQLAKKYSNVILVAAGYTPDYLVDLPNLVELKPVPYILYPSLMRQFDIVCCALDASDEFNKSKSAIKALEAMAAARPLNGRGAIGGAVPVCTKMPVYRRAVQHRHNGLLVDNDEWYDALEMLVRKTKLRHGLAMTGHKWVRKNRDIATGYKLWADAYLDIMGRCNGNND